MPYGPKPGTCGYGIGNDPSRCLPDDIIVTCDTEVIGPGSVITWEWHHDAYPWNCNFDLMYAAYVENYQTGLWSVSWELIFDNAWFGIHGQPIPGKPGWRGGVVTLSESSFIGFQTGEQWYNSFPLGGGARFNPGGLWPTHVAVSACGYFMWWKYTIWGDIDGNEEPTYANVHIIACDDSYDKFGNYTGGVLPGVTIHLYDANWEWGGYNQTAVTDVAGRAIFNNVPAKGVSYGYYGYPVNGYNSCPQVEPYYPGAGYCYGSGHWGTGPLLRSSEFWCPYSKNTGPDKPPGPDEPPDPGEPGCLIGEPRRGPSGTTVQFRSRLIPTKDPDPDAWFIRWHWDFGDGTTSTAQHPTHTYNEVGFYTIHHTGDDTNGVTVSCETGAGYIKISNKPFSYCFVGRPRTGRAPLHVKFEALWNVSRSGAITYDWDFGDGSPHGSAEKLEHTYTSPGTYTVTLILTNAAGSSTCSVPAYIKVCDWGPPTAEFVGEPREGVETLAVTFTDLSVGCICKWEWDYGDGHTLIHTACDSKSDYVNKVVHVYEYPGVYDVTLKVTSGGIDGYMQTLCKNDYITITQGACAPTANFSGQVGELGPRSDTGVDGSPPLTVIFKDETPYATVSTSSIVKRTWNFGDGTPEFVVTGSPAKTVAIHTYGRSGTYNVTLEVKNFAGCGHRLVKEAFVVVGGPGKGVIFICDSNNHRIIKCKDTGEYILAWGSYGSAVGQFSYPTDVCISANGSVLITDMNNSRIQKFDADGKYLSTWGTLGTDPTKKEYVSPIAIAIDVDGHFIVSDLITNVISEISNLGTPLNQDGGPGDKPKQFKGALGVAVDSWNQVYILDAQNDDPEHKRGRIQGFKQLR